MRKENLNLGWTYWPKGNEFFARQIDLPHDAMIHRKRIKRLRNGSYTGFYPSGDYVYMKKLFAGEELRGKKVVLEFEGVYMDATVTLNGQKVGGHVYGYSNFYCDLTDRLNIGEENEIQVDVHAGQVPNARWYPGNGIYRPVNLWVSGKERIRLDGVYIRTRSYSPARMHISVDVEAEEGAEVVTEIYFSGKKVLDVKGADTDFMIPNARLWDAEHPNLYTAKVQLRRGGEVLDEAEEIFGIRQIRYSAAEGLLINGKETLLRGGCVHHDNGLLGACDFYDAEYRKARLLKDAGFNAIRSAHNPISKNMLRACDEIGLYIMDEAFDTWRDNNGFYGFPMHFEECWRDDIEKMVRKDRNHPSVILYSLGNEITDTAREDGAALAGEMAALCHSLDQSIPVTVCPNLFMNVIQKMLGQGKASTAFGGKQISPDDVTNPTEETDEPSDLGGSVAINFLMFAGPVLKDILLTSKRAENASGKTFANVDIAGYNYAHQVYEGHHKLVPDRVIVGSETNGPELSHNWELVKNNKHVIGDFMWTAWDYLGEVGVGRVDYGEQTGVYIKPYPSISAYCGALDLTGDRDINSYLAGAVWETDENPFIGVRPLNHNGEKKYFPVYRKTDAIPSWTWEGFEGKPAEIDVFSKGASAEVFQDGKSIGKRKLKEHQAKFKTVYTPGELTVVSYDASGKAIGRSRLVTAGPDNRLTLNVEDPVIKADGQSLSYIRVSLTDKNGQVKPLVNRRITVKVTGSGTLQAIGSASPMPERPYVGDVTDTYLGRAQIIVRSGTVPGKIKITVDAGDLGAKTVEVATALLR